MFFRPQECLGVVVGRVIRVLSVSSGADRDCIYYVAGSCKVILKHVAGQKVNRGCMRYQDENNMYSLSFRNQSASTHVGLSVCCKCSMLKHSSS